MKRIGDHEIEKNSRLKRLDDDPIAVEFQGAERIDASAGMVPNKTSNSGTRYTPAAMPLVQVYRLTRQSHGTLWGTS